MILQPSGMVCVLVEILVRDEVVLATHHATQAREVALHPIRVLATFTIGFAVVDAALGSKKAPRR